MLKNERFEQRIRKKRNNENYFLVEIKRKRAKKRSGFEKVAR